MSRRVLTVFGGTGLQGGSVVSAVNRRFPGEYQIRVPTRNPNSDKAKKLTTEYSNVELVQCDLNNRRDVDAAVKGAYGVFAVTNFWEPEILQNHHKEIEQGYNLVDASAAAKVEIFIWSGLPDTKAISNGKFNVAFFTNKHEVEKHARSIPHFNAAFVYCAFYYQDFNWFLSKKDDGGLAISAPMKEKTRIGMFDVGDTGIVVAKILDSPAAWIGKIVTTAAEELTGPEVAAIMSSTLHKPVSYHALTAEEYRKTPGANEQLLEMFLYFDEFGGLKPFPGHLSTMKEWIKNSGFTGPQ